MLPPKVDDALAKPLDDGLEPPPPNGVAAPNALLLPNAGAGAGEPKPPPPKAEPPVLLPNVDAGAKPCEVGDELAPPPKGDDAAAPKLLAPKAGAGRRRRAPRAPTKSRRLLTERRLRWLLTERRLAGGYRRGCFRRRRLRQTSFRSSDSGGLFLRYACAAHALISLGVAYSNNL